MAVSSATTRSFAAVRILESEDLGSSLGSGHFLEFFNFFCPRDCPLGITSTAGRYLFTDTPKLYGTNGLIHGNQRKAPFETREIVDGARRFVTQELGWRWTTTNESCGDSSEARKHSQTTHQHHLFLMT